MKPSSTGIFTANSTRSRLSGLVATFSSYWLGVRISRRIAPSCTSPSTPRVLTLESTRLSPPTSWATLFISPSPLCTASSCSLTRVNDEFNLSFKVLESFSSTVSRIFSSCLPLSSRMSFSWVPTVFCTSPKPLVICSWNPWICFENPAKRPSNLSRWSRSSRDCSAKRCVSFSPTIPRILSSSAPVASLFLRIVSALSRREASNFSSSLLLSADKAASRVSQRSFTRV